MVKIKICGLKRLEDIEIVNKYRPDYMGFVFADTKRKVSHELARQLKDKLDPEIISVGVFVDAPKEEITELFENGTIEMAQLHGLESEDYIKDLKAMTDNKLIVIKAIEMSQDTDLLKYDSSNADYLLLDNINPGSGEVFDWTTIKGYSKPIFLAGGISILNIKEALKLMPYCIDLSSGVEVNGFKDEEKIEEIIRKVREYE